MFTGPGLVFTRDGHCHVEGVAVDELTMGPGEVLVEVDVSVVNTDTEAANFVGGDRQLHDGGYPRRYPRRPSCAAVGHIVALPRSSEMVDGYKVGDRVFAICAHGRYAVAGPLDRPVVPLQPDDDARTMVLARTALAALTAVSKTSVAHVRKSAMVIGLGLVGNFAAQLLQIAGMEVLGLDRSEHRVAMATKVGLSALRVAEGGERDLLEQDIGRSADFVVVASGVPDASPVAVALCRDGGDVVLLATPSGPFECDATKMLAEVQRRGIRLLGTPLQSCRPRYSLRQDYLALFRLFRDSRLRTSGLITDVVRPAEAHDIYGRLATRDPELGAVMFDWDDPGPALSSARHLSQWAGEGPTEFRTEVDHGDCQRRTHSQPR